MRKTILTVILLSALTLIAVAQQTTTLPTLVPDYTSGYWNWKVCKSTNACTSAVIRTAGWDVIVVYVAAKDSNNGVKTDSVYAHLYAKDSDTTTVKWFSRDSINTVSLPYAGVAGSKSYIGTIGPHYGVAADTVRNVDTLYVMLTKNIQGSMYTYLILKGITNNSTLNLRWRVKYALMRYNR
jgi:hypothetical protein